MISLLSLRRLPRIAGSLLLFSLVGLAGCGQDPSQQGGFQMPPAQVSVLKVQPTDVGVYREYPARIHGSRQVQVRAQVSGILQEKRYQEGQVVASDEVLFLIDPEPFQIAQRRAEAERDAARADLAHAQREWERISRLFERNTVSERERDQARTQVDQARARLNMAEAVLDDARRNLGYTEVRSPIAGVTGMEDVSEGNLISTGGLLTTITQNDPVHVRFSMPENDALIRRGQTEDSSQAALILPGAHEYSHGGAIDFVASTIDPATGTVSVRAVFPNPDHQLLPGQFVRIRVLLQSLSGVFTIPEQAVSQSAQGPQVFVVNSENKAQARPVRLGPVTEQGQVILGGLESGDRVVTNGHVSLRHQAPVNVAAEEMQ
ncbi:efflux transporter, RND family, MFP subunit [Desulfurispirillum indicum S5]|uniref:Efflux transporter, RND family, MFP subunit n=1 Tax=Desulfurispirillum indicum (strain ATCC BAA-1389 / DSM 22839 / S5) TaxID=653733 RepID=E6W5V7_DESIS|nr:efflux RND transporter periplasmic adaptor subunit [Desulfurispirillum indicum]ADU67242.1 efflux transporter, RND family, MFP subunit [Desulfurispirillum indicum S5]